MYTISLTLLTKQRLNNLRDINKTKPIFNTQVGGLREREKKLQLRWIAVIVMGEITDNLYICILMYERQSLMVIII